MDSSTTHIFGTEGCSSSESGWTMYIASPMQEDDTEYSDDYDGYNAYSGRHNDRQIAGVANDEDDSDESMASDASSGPHQQHRYENGHGTIPFKHNKGDQFKLHPSSATKKEKKEKKSNKHGAKRDERPDATSSPVSNRVTCSIHRTEK